MAVISTILVCICGKYTQVNFVSGPNATVKNYSHQSFRVQRPESQPSRPSFFSRRHDFRKFAERRFGRERRQELDLERRPYGQLANCLVCSFLHPEHDCDMYTNHQYNTCCGILQFRPCWNHRDNVEMCPNRLLQLLSKTSSISQRRSHVERTCWRHSHVDRRGC